MRVTRFVGAALTGCALLLGNASPGRTQQASVITGRITDAATAAPIPWARLQLSPSGQVVPVAQDGRFTIRGISGGLYEVRVIAVGFGSQRKSVNVSPSETVTADFALAAVPYSLDEIVTTATGDQRRLELGTTVGTLRADSLVAFAPVASMSNLLQGRTAGVTVLPSSGTTGAGSRIRIRGANSPSLSNEPLVYLDGVKINSATNSSSLGVGGQGQSRLNDLNPEEIESVEIIMGPSAATLYGTEAANGVVRITTKRGKAGPPNWNVYAEAGRLDDPNRYPDNYRSIGQALVGGVPAGPEITCLVPAIAAGGCVQNRLSTFNPLMTTGVTPISTGNRQQVGASVSGGTDLVQYFISGEYEQEDGTFELPAGEAQRVLTSRGTSELPGTVYRPNALSKVSGRVNLNIRPASTVDVSTSMGYVSSDTRLPQNDNTVLGKLPSGVFGRADVADTVGNSGWGFFRPGEIFSLLRNQNVERFTGSATTNWRPSGWLTGRATLGYDITNRGEIQFDPTAQGPAFGTVPFGTKADTRTQLRVYTADGSATANATLSSRLTSRTTLGGQFTKDVFFQNLASGARLAIGADDIDGAAILSASQTTTTTTKLGAFLEQQLNLNNRLFLTGALRADDNSAFGQDFNTVLFPKASVSYIISDEGFFPKPGFLGLLRLRAAYGASGRQPSATDALTYLVPTSAAIENTSTTAVRFGGLGQAELKPERSTEVELGVDAQFLDDRLNLEVTWFSQRTSDALVGRVLAPSLGASDGGNNQRIENLGELSSRGFELTVNARPIESRSVSWDLALTGSWLRNQLETLGEGIPPVTSGAQRHVPGYPLGGFWERPVSYHDGNGDGMIEFSEITIGPDAVYGGSSTPTREAALASTMTFLNGKLRLQGQLDYKGGHHQLNLTELFRCTATGNNCRGIHDPTAPLDQQARAVTRRSTTTNYGFLESAEFLKLREVSLTWNAPGSFARIIGARHLSLTGAGRNLATWTGYSGVDPEVNGRGQTAFNGFGVNDFLTQPPVRTFLLRLNLGF